MLQVLVQMAALIACGVAWRLLRPAGLDPVVTRHVLTSLVYYLLLPALVLSVLWRAPIGRLTLLIAAAGAVCVILGWLLSSFTCRLCRSEPQAAGAIVLAAAFPNVTYLGLPVLEATFGPWARSVAIQMDLFACTPLLFTLGVLIAAHYGGSVTPQRSMFGELLRIPALWAAIVAVLLNIAQVPLPDLLGGLLELLERGVVPLMLIALGLGLQWNAAQRRDLVAVIPVAVIRLLVVPAIMLLLSFASGLSGDWRAAVILETAMPSMVLGLVFCDRYNLDVSLYAAAVTVTTLLSMVTLPLWYRGLSIL